MAGKRVEGGCGEPKIILEHNESVHERTHLCPLERDSS